MLPNSEFENNVFVLMGSKYSGRIIFYPFLAFLLSSLSGIIN